MTTERVVWSLGFGGRIAHAWRQVGTHVSQFAALCNPALKYGDGYNCAAYKRCAKCEKLVSAMNGRSSLYSETVDQMD